MKVKRLSFILIFGIIISGSFVEGRGRGGGGSRGGSRGSSGRGSSSRGSSSRTSSSSRGTYERKTSQDRGSESSGVHNPKPSAPELKETPTAPKLPTSNQQPAYNPNYRPGQQPPPYPGGSGQNLGQPPPYSGGSGTHVGHGSNQPPPYPGPNQPMPPSYPGLNQPRPPVQSNPQQSGTGIFPPGVGNQPYPRQPGMPNAPYPQQPGVGNQPYPRQPGMSNHPYPRQPGGMPYPQQQGGYGYAQYSGIPIGGSSYAQPYKKKGFLGQIFSGGSGISKKNKYKYGSSYGGSTLGHGMPKAMYPMMPMMMMHKKPKFHSPFRMPFLPLIFFMPGFSPFGHHHHYGHYDQYGQRNGIYSSDYRGGCRVPFKPENSTMECNATNNEAICTLKCDDGFHFQDEAISKETKCWHISGVWRPSRTLPKCFASCGDKCKNGGRCLQPGVCTCSAEYRGENCEHHVLECDIQKFAGRENGQRLSWTCQHNRNETVCNISCRSESHFADEPQSRKYTCSINGEWTPNIVPYCLSETNSTVSEGTTVPTTTSKIETEQ